MRDRLEDLGDPHLKDMETGNVSIQVVSHAPTAGSVPIEVCRKANDQLKQAADKHTSHFAGFVTIPMMDPETLCEELERCVWEVGFVGTLVNNHDSGLSWRSRARDAPSRDPKC